MPKGQSLWGGNGPRPRGRSYVAVQQAVDDPVQMSERTFGNVCFQRHGGIQTQTLTREEMESKRGHQAVGQCPSASSRPHLDCEQATIWEIYERKLVQQVRQFGALSGPEEFVLSCGSTYHRIRIYCAFTRIGPGRPSGQNQLP